MTTMYDSVTVTNLPPDAKAVAYYLDGLYAETEQAIKTQCPNASLLPISVLAGTFLDYPLVAYDVENGNAPASQVASAIKQRNAKGLISVIYYSQNSTVLKEMVSYGIRFANVNLWSAPGVYGWVADWTGYLSPLPIFGSVASQEVSLQAYDMSVTAGNFPTMVSEVTTPPIPAIPQQSPTIMQGDNTVQRVTTQVEIQNAQGWCFNPVPFDNLVSVLVQDQAPAVVGGYTDIPSFSGVASDQNNPNGILVFKGGADGVYGITVISA